MAGATREGLMYGLVAYGWWGLVPIYFHWLGKTPALDILAHRIAWSAVFLGIILTATGRWPETSRCVRTPKLFVPLLVSSLLVAGNWLLYILSVEWKMIVQSSLGYFILPLVSILLGLVVFRERLRPLQYLAIGFAGVGVALLTWEVGTFPWLALGVALSFCVYGMIRKQVPVDGLTGLAVETFLLLPLALGYLIYRQTHGGSVESGELWFKLSLSGVVAAVPRSCASGRRRGGCRSRCSASCSTFRPACNFCWPCGFSRSPCSAAG